MATSEFQANASVKERPYRHPAFTAHTIDPNRIFPNGYTRVSPEQCPKHRCRDTHKHVACCYLDKLGNSKPWCLRFDLPLHSVNHGVSQRSAECLAAQLVDRLR